MTSTKTRKRAKICGTLVELLEVLAQIQRNFLWPATNIRVNLRSWWQAQAFIAASLPMPTTFGLRRQVHGSEAIEEVYSITKIYAQRESKNCQWNEEPRAQPKCGFSNFCSSYLGNDGKECVRRLLKLFYLSHWTSSKSLEIFISSTHPFHRAVLAPPLSLLESARRR